jgi:hypothetical protein
MFDKDYASIQENEIEAIQAIYGDDFISDDSQHFSLLLSANIEELKELVSIQMIVYLPPNYPSASPSISFDHDNMIGLSPRLITRLKNALQEKFEELREIEAIYEIALFVEEFMSLNNTIPPDTLHDPLNKRDAVLEKERQDQKRETKKRDQIKKEYDHEVAQEVEKVIFQKTKIAEGIQSGRSLIWKVTSNSPSVDIGELGSLIGNSGLFSIYLPAIYPLKYIVRTLDISNPFYKSTPQGARLLNDFQRHFQSLVKVKIHALFLYSRFAIRTSYR